jgi:hypothetical protein
MWSAAVLLPALPRRSWAARNSPVLSQKREHRVIAEGVLERRHLRALHEQAVNSSFSVGWAITERERAAIDALPTTVWADAIDADGGHRAGAALAEITSVLPVCALAGYPSGTRVIVRRERPHPGAQLDAFEERDGWRRTPFATDTAVGQLAHLDAHHRAHAPVEDCIRTAKDVDAPRGTLASG